jgi:hypothetical protein
MPPLAAFSSSSLSSQLSLVVGLLVMDISTIVISLPQAHGGHDW